MEIGKKWDDETWDLGKKGMMKHGIGLKNWVKHGIGG